MDRSLLRWAISTCISFFLCEILFGYSKMKKKCFPSLSTEFFLVTSMVYAAFVLLITPFCPIAFNLQRLKFGFFLKSACEAGVLFGTAHVLHYIQQEKLADGALIACCLACASCALCMSRIITGVELSVMIMFLGMATDMIFDISKKFKLIAILAFALTAKAILVFRNYVDGQHGDGEHMLPVQVKGKDVMNTKEQEKNDVTIEMGKGNFCEGETSYVHADGAPERPKAWSISLIRHVKHE